MEFFLLISVDLFRNSSVSVAAETQRRNITVLFRLRRSLVSAPGVWLSKAHPHILAVWLKLRAWLTKSFKSSLVKNKRYLNWCKKEILFSCILFILSFCPFPSSWNNYAFALYFLVFPSPLNIPMSPLPLPLRWRMSAVWTAWPVGLCAGQELTLPLRSNARHDGLIARPKELSSPASPCPSRDDGAGAGRRGSWRRTARRRTRSLTTRSSVWMVLASGRCGSPVTFMYPALSLFIHWCLPPPRPTELIAWGESLF